MQATITQARPFGTLRGSAARVFGRIGQFMVSICENNSRVHRVEALNRLSDAELARAGLRREDIVRHVFRDCLHV